jgi:hypothetical protein
MSRISEIPPWIDWAKAFPFESKVGGYTLHEQVAHGSLCIMPLDGQVYPFRESWSFQPKLNQQVTLPLGARLHSLHQQLAHGTLIVGLPGWWGWGGGWGGAPAPKEAPKKDLQKGEISGESGYQQSHRKEQHKKEAQVRTP